MSDPSLDDHPEIVASNSRIGLALFSIYVLLYGGFIALAVFFPAAIAADAFVGVNVAIVYGLFLIAAALGLALVYMAICRKRSV